MPITFPPRTLSSKGSSKSLYQHFIHVHQEKLGAATADVFIQIITEYDREITHMDTLTTYLRNLANGCVVAASGICKDTYENITINVVDVRWMNGFYGIIADGFVNNELGNLSTVGIADQYGTTITDSFFQLI